MHSIVLFIHVFVAFIIIVLVLVQQGKGADAGASFGSGSSQTVFGSSGAGNFLTHATAILAAIFFTTSFGLALLTKKELGNITPTFPSGEQTQEIPVSVPTGTPNTQDIPAGVVPVPGGGDASKTAPKTGAQDNGLPAGVVPVPGGGSADEKPKTDADAAKE